MKFIKKVTVHFRTYKQEFICHKTQPNKIPSNLKLCLTNSPKSKEVDGTSSTDINWLKSCSLASYKLFFDRSIIQYNTSFTRSIFLSSISEDTGHHIISGGVMVKALDCGIVVREFELQSRFYVHFRTKGMNHLILPFRG